jgi:preprotein translocase subunit SecA
VVREAGRRVLQMRHYDVQMIGGMVCTTARSRRMKTGRRQDAGRRPCPPISTRSPARAFTSSPVNDYLARRDSEWMGRVYRFLGMSVGVIQHDLNDQQRQVAYSCDITYGTNNEFGFDYLRDNMKFDVAAMVPARPPLRDRRRSRQHPDRRSAHAADHFGPAKNRPTSITKSIASSRS